MHQPFSFQKFEEVAKIDRIRLGNLYLCHARAFINKTKVRNADGAEEEPNEGLLRWIEWEANIKEDECVQFRETVVAQLADGRMDVLYHTFSELFDFLITLENEKVQRWLREYPEEFVKL